MLDEDMGLGLGEAEVEQRAGPAMIEMGADEAKQVCARCSAVTIAAPQSHKFLVEYWRALTQVRWQELDLDAFLEWWSVGAVVENSGPTAELIHCVSADCTINTRTSPDWTWLHGR